MGHPPKIGQGRTLSSSAEELTAAPGAELLGSISPDALASHTLPPPPWEVDARYARHDTDARRFVTVPADWELRWLNPDMVRREGMRDWKAVPGKGDSRVRVHNDAMIAVDNTIRRGGDQGDFLAWMYKHWVDSRTRLKREKIARLTGEARARQERTREEINRGSYGPYVHVDSARHPTHTTGDGRTMTD